MIFTPLEAIVKWILPGLIALVLSACSDDDKPTASTSTIGISDLDFDWTSSETGDTWSFDANGKFWFFTADLLSSDSDFSGTWSLEGNRITLVVEERGTLILQVELKNKVPSITLQCDESASFFTTGELTACRATPTTTYSRAGLFD